MKEGTVRTIGQASAGGLGRERVGGGSGNGGDGVCWHLGRPGRERPDDVRGCRSGFPDRPSDQRHGGTDQPWFSMQPSKRPGMRAGALWLRKSGPGRVGDRNHGPHPGDPEGHRHGSPTDGGERRIHRRGNRQVGAGRRILPRKRRGNRGSVGALPGGEILSQGLGATSQQIAAATEEESANLEEVSVQIAARRGHQKLLQEVPDIRQPPSRDEGWSPHRST
jgi:hypothetical protein